MNSLTHRSYLLPASLAFATPGPITFALLGLTDQTGLSAALFLLLLLPLFLISAIAFILATVLCVRRTLKGEQQKAAATATLLLALALSIALAESASFAWLGAALASLVAVASVIWLGRMVWTPLPNEAAGTEQAI
jgi:uncharacterized membrane protein YfbV (UPF0208 family)